MEQGPGNAPFSRSDGDKTLEKRRRSRRPESGDIRLALRWYFLGEGKGARIAACACHVSLLTLLGTVLLTVLTMGSMVLGTIFSIHADSPIARHLATSALNDATALQFVSTVDAVLRGGFASDVLIADSAARTAGHASGRVCRLPGAKRRARSLTPRTIAGRSRPRDGTRYHEPAPRPRCSSFSLTSSPCESPRSPPCGAMSANACSAVMLVGAWLPVAARRTTPPAATTRTKPAMTIHASSFHARGARGRNHRERRVCPGGGSKPAGSSAGARARRSSWERSQASNASIP
jgi:hypothetical protein